MYHTCLCAFFLSYGVRSLHLVKLRSYPMNLMQIMLPKGNNTLILQRKLVFRYFVALSISPIFLSAAVSLCAY